MAKELDFTTTNINSISKHYSGHNRLEKLKEVFMQWKRKKNPPFTLGILLRVLKSESVGAVSLAQQLCKSIYTLQILATAITV